MSDYKELREALTLARREVLWRGRTYRLNAAARLA